MQDPDKPRSLYIDLPTWKEIKVDDFMVAIGKNKSNSVYHVAEIKSIVPNEKKRMVRFYLKVFKSDLLTAIKRDKDQLLIPIYWYSRKKKK